MHRKTLSGLAVAALLASTAPVASAMPVDGPLRPTEAGAVLKDTDPRQLDMHASTVQKQDAAPKDLRSEAAADAGVRPQTGTDLRGEAAAGKPATEAPLGLPTWPVDPQPITPIVVDEPVATGGDDGLEWPLSGILLAGALLLGGTVGILGAHFRVRQSHA